MRYWINEARSGSIRDADFVKELKTFVRHDNGTWGHIKGDGIYDDRVMSMLWALFTLNEDIIDKYFVVKNKNLNGKPITIEPIYDVTGVAAVQDDMDSDFSGLPTMFGTKSVDDSFSDNMPEMEWLNQNGWTML